MDSMIFRQKSLDKISSPEQMNDYIRVTNPSVWMVLAAVIALLVGVCVWGVFGRLDTALQTGGVCTDGTLVCYIGEADFTGVTADAVVEVDGREYAVSSVAAAPAPVGTDAGSYLLHLMGLTEGDWVYAVTADAPGLEDGTYRVSVVVERVRPLDFVLN